MATIGGMRSFFGPVVGAAILTGLEEIVGRHTEYWSFFIGAAVLIVVLLFPRGVLGIRWSASHKKEEEKETRVAPDTGN